jgi:hypothetical protein
MLRYDIINALIKKYGYRSYLEIGTQGDKCLMEVDCFYKVGVDPDPVIHYEDSSDHFYQMKSDDFFSNNDEIFDIVFIDGLHEDFQVRRDIKNAMRSISPGGAVVVHDCNPMEEVNQAYPEVFGNAWNGNVWKAWMVYRKHPNLKMFVVDTDHGCGVIMQGRQEPFRPKRIVWDEFKQNKKQWLNLISVDEFNAFINEKDL